MFAAAIHFHPNLIFAGRARSLLLERSSVRCFTVVGSSLAHKYETRVEVANALDYCDMAIITAIKSFIVQAPEL